jgi:drug/metabolite transporter (DMT)-like permease
MSTPVTNPMGQSEEAAQHPAAHARTARTPLPDDGTRQLLQGAFWTLLVGILAALATKFLFGGIGIHGPHTNGGWLSLIVAMMCLPFGCMLLLLGGAKYLRNRRLASKSH